MQIHEITTTKLDEGLGNFLGGVASKLTNRKRTNQTAMLGNKVAKIWSAYAQQLKSVTTDPARYNTMYQQALTAFVQKNLLAGQSINSAINRQEINQLITQIAAAKDNPQQVSSLILKLVQQAAVSQQDVASTALVKVLSTNPTILQYRNVDYAQNADGDWANQQTQKVPDESFQAFLDSEARRAGA
jgi:hypothetical protein